MIRALILAALIGVAAALWTWTRPGAAAISAVGDTVVVQVLDNGFHTDLAMPRAALIRRGGPLAHATASLASGDWILIGWGDARFYVDQSPIADRLPDGARAFFRPGNASVVMLDPETGDPSRRFAPASRRTLILSPEAFAGLRKRVQNSLLLLDGRPRLSTARPGDGARFFASREHFWIGYLCNSWTARVLNAAGVPIRPARSVTSGEVIGAVDRTGRAVSPIGRSIR